MSACGHRATEPPELTGGVAEPWRPLGCTCSSGSTGNPAAPQDNRAGEGVLLGLGPRVTYPPLPHFIPASSSHLGQASEKAGATGGAAADRSEGIAEEEAVAGQGIQVRGGDGTIVVGSTFKASVVR